MNYSLCILAVLVSTSLFIAEAKKKPNDSTKKYEGDFEFVDEVSGMKVDEIIYFSNRKKFMAPSTTASLPTQRESCFQELLFCISSRRFFLSLRFCWKDFYVKNNFLFESRKQLYSYAMILAQ